MKNTALLSCLLVLSLTGCALQSKPQPGQAVFVSPHKNLDAEELQQITENMTDAMLNFPPIHHITQAEQPRLQVQQFANKTPSAINDKALTDALLERLQHQQQFALSADTPEYALQSELNQTGDGYLLQLKLKNIESGALVWEDQTRIEVADQG